MTFLLAGFALGVAGSVHCLLMCGPLVLASQGIPVFRRSWRGLFAYHAGRLLTYELVALAASLAARVLVLSGLQRALSIACGVMLLAGAVPASLPPSVTKLVRLWLRPILRGSSRAGRMAGSHPSTARFIGGVLNGLLPCGLSYAAAVMAAASGGVASAALLMGGFGAGTLPALVGLSASAPHGLSLLRLRRVTPLMLGAVGIMLVIRGALPVESAHSSEHVAGVHLLHRR